MISYYEVLKASKGLYVADTYAMMWGRQISSDGKIYEITGIPPLKFISNGSDLIDYRISGNTIQNGEPSPESPAEVVGCGERTENLVYIPDANSITIRNCVIDDLSDKYIKIYGNGYNGEGFSQVLWDLNNIENIIGKQLKISGKITLEQGVNVNPRLYVISYDIDNVQLSSVSIDINTYERFFTIPSETKTVSIVCRIDQNRSANVADAKIKFSDVMLSEVTTTPDHYIPYGYKIPVTVSGVNLFDYNWLWDKENTKLNDYFNYIKIVMKPNTEYTVSNNYRVNYFSSPNMETALIVTNSETVISTVNGGVEYSRIVRTASDGVLQIAYRTNILSNNYKDLIVDKKTLDDGTYHIQIAEGSAALPYEPYHEPITTPIYIGTEPLHKIGDYADYVDFKRGVVVRRVQKLVLTGNENWRIENGDNLYIDTPISDAMANYIVISTHLASISAEYVFDNNARISATKRFNYTDEPIKYTLSSFKSFLAAQYEAGTPVTVWYVLAEPEEEQIDLSKIQTIKGTNILTADTEVQPSEMYIKYKK